MYQCSESGSASRSVSQRYGSEDPDPHPDLYQNVTDPHPTLVIRIRTKISRLPNTSVLYTCVYIVYCTCTVYGYVGASSYSAKLHPVQEDFFISYSDSNVCFFPSRLLINISVSL